MNFIGTGTPLSVAGFDHAAAEVGAAALWSVLAVETSGCGFLPDRRPKILFERHVFSRLTRHRFDAAHPDLSDQTPGDYGAAGAHQYDRLQAALALDADAALMSASWGLGQIMGENFAAAGFASVQAMVEAFVGSEDVQLAAMAAFIVAGGMAGALKTRNWVAFARLYNGPNYAENGYDRKLAHFYALYSHGGPPDPSVRAAQVWLTYDGLYTGAVDGVAGPATTAAIKAFQTARGLPITGLIDATLMAALQD